MRHLLLARHAKSSWDDPSVDDHDRPLAPRGERALPKMAEHLAAAPHRPDLVLCSSARRTVDTLDGVRAAVPDARIEIDDRVYAAGSGTLLNRLGRLDPDLGCVMVVGHNPGLQELAVLLIGAGDADLRSQVAAKLPTGAIVTLSFAGSWEDLAAGSARIDDLFLPRPPRP